MDTTNEQYVPEDVLHSNILYESERYLLHSLFVKDMDSVKILWEIVSFYSKVTEREEASRNLSVKLNSEDGILFTKKFLEGNGDNDE